MNNKLKKDKFKIYTEWIMVIVIFSICIYLQTNLYTLIINNNPNYTTDYLNFYSSIGKISVVLGTFIMYIFIAIGIHLLSIIININAETNFSKLLRKIGLAFIVLIPVTLLKTNFADNFIKKLNQASTPLKLLKSSNFSQMSNYLDYISYFLIISFSSIYTKKIYKISWFDCSLVCSIMILIIMLFRFFKNIII